MTALVHTASLELPTTLEFVFAAFADSGRLERWFCDHAVIEPRIGGAYRFWGPSVYETTTEQAATQVLRDFDAPQRLAFVWPLHGVDSEVSIELGPGDPQRNPGGVQLALRHAFDRVPDVARPDDLLDDLWRLLGGNLVRHVLGEGEIVRVDFADARPRLERSITVEAPRARVWRALIQPDQLAQWMWANAAQVEPRVGGRYSYGWTYDIKGATVHGGPTRILELQEPVLLVTDWPDWRGDARVPEQQVTWRLDAQGEGTRVSVVHAGFVRAVDFSDFPFGWDEFLRGLKQLVESKD